MTNVDWRQSSREPQRFCDPLQEGQDFMAIDWTTDLATGDDEIDADHRAIYASLSSLLEAMKGNHMEHVPAIERSLEELLRAHFAVEERRMEVTAYPGLLQHRAHHVRLLRELSFQIQRLTGGGARASLALEFGEWFGQYLRDHLRNADRDMGRHLRLALVRPR